MSSVQKDARLDDGVSDRVPEGAALISSFCVRIGIAEPTCELVDYNELREHVATEQLAKWRFTR